MKSTNNSPVKTTQIKTQGILNLINERYGCNQKRHTVSIQNLIRYHKPKQNAELIALIASHQEDGAHKDCKCKCRSKGTLETFTDRLYKSYLKYKELNPKTEYKNWEDCYIFMHYLFVEGSLVGDSMEKRYVREFNRYFMLTDQNYKCKTASQDYDFRYSIDLIITNDKNEEVAFYQVKPISYTHIPKKHPVVQQNLAKNKAFGKKVVYVYYDKKCNLTETIQDSFMKSGLI